MRYITTIEDALRDRLCAQSEDFRQARAGAEATVHRVGYKAHLLARKEELRAKRAALAARLARRDP